MDFTLKPSLQFMTLTKLTVEMWCQEYVMDLIQVFFDGLSQIRSGKQLPLPKTAEKRRQWQVIENELTKKLEASYCKKMSRDLSRFIKPIGLEILKWMEYHLDFLGQVHVKKSVCRLVWAPHGIIDKKRTAEILIKDENLGIIPRYRLACIYCAEDVILKLWQIMPAKSRKQFYHKNQAKETESNLIVSLISYLVVDDQERMVAAIRQVENLQCLVMYAFRWSYNYFDIKYAHNYFSQIVPGHDMRNCSEWAIRIFSKKYTHEVEFLPTDCDADFFIFLFSLMSTERRKAFLRRSKVRTLHHLLDWPCQSIFMEVIESVWDSISDIEFLNLLICFTFKVKEGYRDWSYQDLIREFWQRSEVSRKQYVIDRCTDHLTSHSLMQYLLFTGDTENMELILQDATQDERIRILNAHIYICCTLVIDGKWDILKFFFQKCISSEVIRFGVEEKLQNKLRSSCPGRNPICEEKDFNEMSKLFQELSFVNSD